MTTTAGLFLIACGSTPAAPPSEPAAPAASASTASAPPSSDTSSARKRTRTGASAPPARDGTKPKNGRALNPRDPSGRMVFVRADDHCFIEVATKNAAADGPTVQATEVVDCPPEANDPAFDHCTAQVVLEQGANKCYCVTGAGHPRPMPNPTPCPKGL